MNMHKKTNSSVFLWDGQNAKELINRTFYSSSTISDGGIHGVNFQPYLYVENGYPHIISGHHEVRGTRWYYYPYSYVDYYIYNLLCEIFRAKFL